MLTSHQLSGSGTKRPVDFKILGAAEAPRPHLRAPTFAPPPARPVLERTPDRLAMGVRARGARPAPRTALRPRAARRVHIVHGREPRDGHDLPPGARGGADGAKVPSSSSSTTWRNLRGAPPWVRVAARWWGDEGVEKSKRPWVRLVPGADASFAFPVKAKPSGFSRYCRDAVAVVLEFSDGRTGRRIAAASVDVSRLDVRQPVDVHVPLLSRAGATLGRVRARVVVDYLPDAVSSFELNEHLAKIDDGLPLAPNREDAPRKPIARADRIRTIRTRTPARRRRRRIGTETRTRRTSPRGGTVGRSRRNPRRRRRARPAGSDPSLRNRRRNPR